jgi:hypothetical protein
MSIISHREYILLGIENEDLSRFIDEIKTFLDEGCLRCALSQGYVINISKDNVTCCGHFPVGITVEIEGPKKEPIDNWDSKIQAKISEICTREGIKHDDFTPPDMLYLSETGVPTTIS